MKKVRAYKNIAYPHKIFDFFGRDTFEGQLYCLSKTKIQKKKADYIYNIYRVRQQTNRPPHFKTFYP